MTFAACVSQVLVTHLATRRPAKMKIKPVSDKMSFYVVPFKNEPERRVAVERGGA